MQLKIFESETSSNKEENICRFEKNLRTFIVSYCVTVGVVAMAEIFLAIFSRPFYFLHLYLIFFYILLFIDFIFILIIIRDKYNFRHFFPLIENYVYLINLYLITLNKEMFFTV